MGGRERKGEGENGSDGKTGRGRRRERNRHSPSVASSGWQNIPAPQVVSYRWSSPPDSAVKKTSEAVPWANPLRDLSLWTARTDWQGGEGLT